MLKLLYSPYFLFLFYFILFFLNCQISYFFSRLQLIFNKFSCLTGKKAVLYVGNLDETVTEDKLREYIQKRSEKAGIRQPDIFSCSIIRREEGELGSWGAHLAIDHA